MQYPEIFYSTPLVLCIMPNGGLAPASGFFYESGANLFFVSTAHTFRSPEDKHEPTAIAVVLHEKPRTTAVTGRHKFDLYAGGHPLWKTHPTHKRADIGVIPIDRAQVQNFEITPFTKESLLPNGTELPLGSRVLIAGQMSKLYHVGLNLPIFRGGTIATLYGSLFGSEPFFLLDAESHYGMSGAAAIITKRDGVPDEAPDPAPPGYYLLGVNAGYILATSAKAPDRPSRLTTIWYAHLIEEIIATF